MQGRSWGAEESVADFHSGNVATVQVGSGTAWLSKFRGQRQALQRFWTTHKDVLTQEWLALDSRNRHDFFRSTCPFMPDARGVPYATAPDGTREFVQGASYILPEMNVRDLVTGDTFLQLLASWSTPFEAELIRDNIKLARSIIAENKFRPKEPRVILDKQFVNITPRSADLGVVHRTLPEQLSMVRMAIKEYAAATGTEWACFKERADLILGTFGGCLDQLSQKLFKRRFVALSLPGCARCGAFQSKDASGSGDLSLCPGCELVPYCSEECRAAHWAASHHRDCQPTQTKTVNLKLVSQQQPVVEAPPAQSTAQACQVDADAMMAELIREEELEKAQKLSAAAPGKKKGKNKKR